MAIETSHAGSTQSAAASGASQAAKNRGKGQDAAGGAGAFSSLLSGMGSLQADEDALAGVASGVADTDAQAKGKGKTKALGGADVDASDAAPDAAQLAAAGLATAADPADTAADQAAAGAKGLRGHAARVAGAPGQPDAGLIDNAAAADKGRGLNALSRLTDAGADLTADSIAELVAGLRMPDASSGARAGLPGDASQGAATHTPTVGLAGRGEDNPLLGAHRAAQLRALGFDPSKNAGSSLSMSSGPGAINSRSTAALADARDAKSTALSVSTAALDPTTTVAMLAAADAGGDSAASGRGRERQGGSQAFAPGALPGATADPAAATATGATGELSFAAVAASQQLTPEELLARQVSFLVTEKTQSAELKLDGFGDQPVEVSITLTGNEAQVAFRSDHAGARELLEGAVPHLKEMLQSEGLLLSGVSVGTSGQGGTDGGDAQANREGGNSGRPEPTASPATTPRAAKPQGVLDVFA